MIGEDKVISIVLFLIIAFQYVLNFFVTNLFRLSFFALFLYHPLSPSHNFLYYRIILSRTGLTTGCCDDYDESYMSLQYPLQPKTLDSL